ncbi:MAG: hypothetical protein SGJ20_03325, partial [Planctomycetota bacterium]|nr:hypothetical protein [Planctomycetota bacterium]
MFIDYAVILAYLAMMLGIGLYYRRFADKNLDNFFLAGRKVPGWLNGVSYSSALVSADAATAYGGLAAVTGASICWFYLTRFSLALFLGGVLFAVFWRRMRLFTALEFYELRFSGNAASLMRFWIAFRTSVIALPAWTGVTLLAACKIMGPVAGMSKWETLCWVLPVSFIYVFMAGYQGVVVSNLVQMVVFTIGTGAVALLTLARFGGPTQLTAELTASLGTAGEQMTSLIPPLEHPDFTLAIAGALLIGQSIGYGGDASPVGGAVEGQRILSTRTPREAVTMYVVTAVTLLLFVWLVSIPCIAAPLVQAEVAARQAGPELAGKFDREESYGLLMKEMLPSGLLGLTIAGLLAGVMSTVSDNLNFGSQVMASDLYRRWINPRASDKHLLHVGKACMGIILAIAILIVFKVDMMITVAVYMMQLSAAELPANWAQWWWWRFNGPARIAASLG